MYFIVYKTTNLINNKFYIGVHKQKDDPNIEDGYLGTNRHLRNSIKKYGKENFKRETLFCFDNKEDAFEMESMIVCEKFISRPDVYNISPGGVGNVLLGKQVVELGIGIHALTSEERKEIQRIRISNTSKEKLSSASSKGGKVGGKKCADLKLGIHGFSKEKRKIISNLGIDIQKQNKLGFYNPDVQREMGKRGGVKNKGFVWYTNGISDFKYTQNQQLQCSFEDFLLSNPKFSKGRSRVKRLNTSIQIG